MKNNMLKSLLVMSTVFLMIGCGGGSSSPVNDVPIDLQQVSIDGSVEVAQIELPTEVQDAIDTGKSILTQDLKEAIAYMYNEEGLAYDVYMNIYNYQVDHNLPTVGQLKQIASGEQGGAEKNHIEAVNELAIKYDLNITDYPDVPEPYSVDGIGNGNYSAEDINVLYKVLYEKGIVDKQNALEVGCMVEVVDILDLIEHIEEAEKSNAPDVVSVFNFLLQGSYKHYQKFDQGLKDMDIDAGCCIVPAALDYESFCNDTYLTK